MGYLKWIVVALAVIEAGWMTFDGSRALLLGDYVTPRTGPHQGQLGPWSKIVSAIGIPPRSTFMKSTFVAYGMIWLLVAAAYAFGMPWASRVMVIAAAGSLWYLPLGPILGGIQLVILLFAK